MKGIFLIVFLFAAAPAFGAEPLCSSVDENNLNFECLFGALNHAKTGPEVSGSEQNIFEVGGQLTENPKAGLLLHNDETNSVEKNQ